MSATAFVLSVQQHGRTSNVSKTQFPSVKALADFVSKAPPTSDKVASLGIVGATFSGNVRANENIQTVTAACLDFDTPLNEEHFDSVCAILESENISFVAHNTWRNHGRFAVTVPFSQGTDLAGHAAAIAKLRSILGPYGNFAAESGRPGQVRFVSSNPEYNRKVQVFEGALLEVPAAGESLPANVASIAPIPPKQSADRFAIYSDQASPEQKSLFLLALRHDLIPDRVEDYPRWQPLLYAAFRAWAVNSKQLTESQRELVEALTEWSKRSAKYKDGCIEEKLTSWVRERGGGQKLFIHSVLAVEVEQSRMRHAIKDDPDLDFDTKVALSAAYTEMVGAPVVEVFDTTELDAAADRRQAAAVEAARIRLGAATILATMPAPTPRFAEFRDLLTAMTTQNSAEFWELSEHEWNHKLRPAPMLMGLVQIAAMGFSPHVLYRDSEITPEKALNPYFLNIAKAGTGKSTGIAMLEGVLQKTAFSNSTCNTKLFSATALWVNFFEPRGNIQLVFSEEAESLIGKAGQVDMNLSSLHTMLKQMFDKGVPGTKYRPSAQVQRQMAELSAPWMAVHLAGTPALLRNDVGASMLNDGFMSRMIVSIDERDEQDRSFEDRAAEKLKRIRGIGVGGSLSDTISKVAKFMNDLWRDSDSPAGREFFTVMPGEDKTQEIVAHFENIGLQARYITPPKAQDKEFSDLLIAAADRWPTPDSVRGTDVESNIESLRVRAETKLTVLASLLTLIADPRATEVNMELAVWAEKFLYLTQWGFYQHLLQNDTALGLAPKWRVSDDMLGKLRPATLEGGPLFKGSCDSNTLRSFSRAWRAVVRDLRKPTTSQEYQTARALIDELEIEYRDGEKNARTFYLLRGLD